MRYLTLFFLLSMLGGAHAGQVSVAVASNFLAPAQKLVKQFEQQSGHRVRISSGSTGKLYAQIRNGAPFDVFLAANVLEPLRLEKEGSTVPGSRFTYARGRLALIAFDKDVPLSIDTLRSAQRLSMANPKLAPYGRAAQQVMLAQGIDTKQKKIIMAENVAQAFLYVQSGNTPLGFVALSQVVAHYGEKLPANVWLPEATSYEPIEQQAVLTRRAQNNDAAKQFIAFLQHAETRKQIVGFGYTE